MPQPDAEFLAWEREQLKKQVEAGLCTQAEADHWLNLRKSNEDQAREILAQVAKVACLLADSFIAGFVVRMKSEGRPTQELVDLRSHMAGFEKSMIEMVMETPLDLPEIPGQDP
jgi:hypothetical protein